MHLSFPFAAIVGQERMKLALILNIINPALSGVLIRGEKGTGKSTACRALAEILPQIPVLRDSAFRLSPQEVESGRWDHCLNGGAAVFDQHKVAVVELPVGATEDRVAGSLDLERALTKGEKHFEPGLLATAHRGILYVDEVNLLDDHVVDLLLDSAAMGVNSVEREGVSFSHPARFTLVGTMNPEEGELRPQLLDRFGLCVNVTGINDPEQRVQVMERRAAFDQEREAFAEQWRQESLTIAQRVTRAKELLPRVEARREILLSIADLCIQAGIDGHRGDIITLKTAKTLAAWSGREDVAPHDVETAAELSLPHRMRRQPFGEMGAAPTAGNTVF